MDNSNQNPTSGNLLTLTDEAITVETAASNETSAFLSTQVSKVTNDESGQNYQNN